MTPFYMNSSQPGHMRSQGQYHQGFGNYPHHVAMDASSPASCECWPTPSPCYGSCIHGNFPPYNSYWPPCYPPQVPYHCPNHSGFYPHSSHAPPYYIHQPFPAGYQPGCESVKDVPGEHRCTKCSPQMFYLKNDRGVVIEEHEPEYERGSQGEAALPVRSTNYSYPIIWLPRENQDHVSSVGSGSHGQPPAQDMKLQKCDPKFWNGVYPLDESSLKSLVQNQDRKRIENGNTVELPFNISKLKSMLQGQDLKETQMQKNKEEPGQLPYPMFWIPSHGKREDVEASESKECGSGERDVKSFPTEIHFNEGQTAQHKGGEEGNFECKVPSDADGKSSMRNIPVESHLREPRNIPVQLSEKHLPKPTEPTKRIAKSEPVENSKKEQSLSSPKPSRLPPVCLRVDPLPKKRNGDSKSLKPPRRKEQPLTSEDTKVASPLSSKKAEKRIVSEARNVKCEEANNEKKMSEGRPNATRTEKESVENDSNLRGVSCEIVKIVKNREKPAMNTFTEEEAARVIQSAYRGYDNRRWEPIKKLKEIATVREQMGDVKRRIKALQVVSPDQHGEEKEIVILGEMVMSLLLKLDSIQGLHPSIRDHRKSLARELSDIQEKLDSLKQSSVEEAVEEQVEINSHTRDCPLEESRLAEEKKMVLDSNTEKVLPSPEEHQMSPMNKTDEQLVGESKEGTGLSETLVMDPEPATETHISEANSTSIPEKIVAVETVLPVNPSSADGDEITVTNNEEDKVMVVKLEEPPHKLSQVMEPTRGPDLESPENVTKASESEVDTLENEDRKGDDDTVSPPEKDVGVINDETQLLSHDSSSSYDHEVQTTVMDGPETVCYKDTNVDHSSDNSKGIGQETCEPQEERKVFEQEETKKLIEENQRFKEMMETLVKEGREQLQVISSLTGRVKSLEKQLSQKKKTRIGRRLNPTVQSRQLLVVNVF